tara:strand:- start:312 stop:776 length:465 start_codon:yes stop_codon:yes gene_type:complete
LFSQTLFEKNLGQFQKKKLQKGFLDSFFSYKHFHRKFPIQAIFHVALDGALVGVLITVSIMSTVALHSQYLWIKSFTKLEKTRDLNRRILESTSILEGYLLKNQNLSKDLVPTKAEDLIYVSRPNPQNNGYLGKGKFKKKFLERISNYQVKSGY